MVGAGTSVEEGRPVRLTQESRRDPMVAIRRVLAVAAVGMVRSVQFQKTLQSYNQQDLLVVHCIFPKHQFSLLYYIPKAFLKQFQIQVPCPHHPTHMHIYAPLSVLRKMPPTLCEFFFNYSLHSMVFCPQPSNSQSVSMAYPTIHSRMSGAPQLLFCLQIPEVTLRADFSRPCCHLKTCILLQTPRENPQMVVSHLCMTLHVPKTSAPSGGTVCPRMLQQPQ